jgi:hypothetical protein
MRPVAEPEAPDAADHVRGEPVLDLAVEDRRVPGGSALKSRTTAQTASTGASTMVLA